MRARRPLGPISLPINLLALGAVVALVVLGASLSARAAAGDPFEEAPAKIPAVPESNVAAPSQQAPASAPAGSEANFPTGLVERLPSSAYPEPVIRGLYGGSLWLDMQGHQWPYYPRIGVGISGYGWADTMYKLTRIGDPGQSPKLTRLFGQGRFALRVTPTYSNGSWFAQAQAELIANVNQLDGQPDNVDTDDIWVRTGVWNSWDVTVGRFEGFPVYHLGMGLDLNTDERNGAWDNHGPTGVPQAYLASYLYYRPTGAMNIALHAYPGFLRGLRLELLAQWGNNNTVNTIGARPALIYDRGWFKLRFAAEYQYLFAVDPAPAMHQDARNRGVAGSVQFVVAPWIEFGPNIGRSINDQFTNVLQPNGEFALDTGRSGDLWSYGGFVNVRPVINDMLIGAGVNFASSSNLHVNTAGENDHATNTQYFLALQYLVHHQLFVKLVGGYATTHYDYSFSSQTYDNDMFSVRLRLMFLY